MLVRSPVYQQLNERLRALLVEDFRRGDQFLTERRISEKFQVSRATANKALASLVSEGLLEFRKGRGTFVRCEVIDYDLQALVSFTEKAKVAGKQPRTRVLEFRTTSASQVSPEMPDTLKVDPGEPLWEMQRLRLADATAVILEHRYVVQNLCPELTERDVQGSLYAAWTQKHGLRIGGADDVIRAVAVKGQAARLLEVPPRTPVLEVISVGFLEDGRPLWWERTLYRGDQYEFHSRLGPMPSSTPARGMLRAIHGPSANWPSADASR